MSKNFAHHVTTKAPTATPQSQPIPGKAMVRNSAGGYTFQVDDWTRLDRFLILGAEGGTYYASERKLVKENAKTLEKCLKADGRRAVNRIVEISQAGRAPKNDAAVFALAFAATVGDDATKQLVYQVMPQVCRTGTDLFSFTAQVDQMRGWGRGLRRAVANWYLSKQPGQLAYQVTKYQQRDGWSHKDLLRLSHVETANPEMQAVLRYIRAGLDGMGEYTVKRRTKNGERAVTYPPVNAPLPELLMAVEAAKKATNEREIVKLIRDNGLVREVIPTTFLNSPLVWDALLEKMPITAMIRNLGKMSAVGLLRPMSDASKAVVSRLADADYLRKGRVHPLKIYFALKTYAMGHGLKGKLTWNVVSQVSDALDGAFYKAFGNVVPTGKNWLLALDVSGSMGSAFIGGSPHISARDASAALALVTANVEANHHFVAFTSGSSPSMWSRSHGMGSAVTPLDISPRMRLTDAVQKVSNLPFGGTDCALPMLYADQQKLDVDAFVVLTDNETWAGSIQPVQALQQYRRNRGRDAKLIVVGMTATSFTIADPNDSGMLDVVGFDAATPQIMSDFVIDGQSTFEADDASDSDE